MDREVEMDGLRGVGNDLLSQTVHKSVLLRCAEVQKSVAALSV
jgi:hypothetical protein